jgi:putative SOS response-associated peptidase YedK
MGGEQVSIRSATIITTEPNEAMATIHDRMPVVLAPESWERWLDPTHTDTRDVGDLLVPAAPELTVIRPVAALVNNVRNDGPALIADLPAPDELPDPDAEQGTLF